MSEALASISAMTFCRAEQKGGRAVAVGLLGLALGRAEAAVGNRDGRALTAGRCTASAACNSAERPARTEPVKSDARISAGSIAPAPTIAALSFSA